MIKTKSGRKGIRPRDPLDSFWPSDLVRAFRMSSVLSCTEIRQGSLCVVTVPSVGNRFRKPVSNPGMRRVVGICASPLAFTPLLPARSSGFRSEAHASAPPCCRPWRNQVHLPFLCVLSHDSASRSGHSDWARKRHVNRKTPSSFIKASLGPVLPLGRESLPGKRLAEAEGQVVASPVDSLSLPL